MNYKFEAVLASLPQPPASLREMNKESVWRIVQRATSDGIYRLIGAITGYQVIQGQMPHKTTGRFKQSSRRFTTFVKENVFRSH